MPLKSSLHVLSTIWDHARSTMNVLRVAAIMTLAAVVVTVVRAQQALPRSVKDGVYTIVQANRGKTLYDEKCVECHGTMTTATPDMAPLLNDHVFQTAWKDRSLAELFDRIRDTMPPNKTAALSAQQLVDLIAYLLSANALPAGDIPLANDVETLKQIRLDAGQP